MIVKRDYLFLGCQLGHNWRSIGGKNCGCEWMTPDGVEHGPCSVPVMVCSRCGDCDYGENDEAAQAKADCAAERGEAQAA